MRALALCLGFGILLTVACGGSSNKNSNGRDSKTGMCSAVAGQTCTGVDAYDSCVTTACDAEAKAALGSGYASGSYSGPCADYMKCVLACPCDATATSCQTNCYSKVTSNAACMTPAIALSTCIDSAACAEPVCSGGTSTGTGGGTATYTNASTATYTNAGTATFTNASTATFTSLTTGTGGPNCTKLQTCCNSLAAGSTSADCSSVNSLSDASCASLLTTYAQYGVCK
ncbi:MAG TPA: hypothetical protein VF518_16050 [Polyangia bacterium]